MEIKIPVPLEGIVGKDSNVPWSLWGYAFPNVSMVVSLSTSHGFPAGKLQAEMAEVPKVGGW